MGKKTNIIASFSGYNKHVKAELSLVSFLEGKAFIVYAPDLDLSAAGTSEEDALNSFSVALEEFLRYTLAKNTLKSELIRLGWKIKGSKNNLKVKSPIFTSLLETNKELHKIVEKKDFKKVSRKVELPAFA